MPFYEISRRKFASPRIKGRFRHFLRIGSKHKHNRNRNRDRDHSRFSPFSFHVLEDCLPNTIAINLIMPDRNNPYTKTPYSSDYYAMCRQAAELPVTQRMPELLQAIQNNPVTIIIGETGSGKSTQIPKYILESLSSVFEGDVCLTQPRKLAAQSVSPYTSLSR